jgi:hypothetical protein
MKNKIMRKLWYVASQIIWIIRNNNTMGIMEIWAIKR